MAGSHAGTARLVEGAVRRGVVGDRPFVWVDNEVGEVERMRFAGEHQLVHTVDPRIGLAAGDFLVIRNWAEHKSFADKAFRPHA